MRLLFTLDQDGAVHRLLLHPRRFSFVSVAGDGGRVSYWEWAKQGTPRLRAQLGWGGEIMRNRFPPDPHAAEWRGDQLVHHTSDVAFSSDDDLLAVIGPSSKIELRQLPDLSLRMELGAPGQYQAVAFDGLGRVIADGWATAGTPLMIPGARVHPQPEYRMSVFDVRTGTFVEPSAPGGWGGLAVAPAGNMVSVTRQDQGSSTVRFARAADLRLYNVSVVDALSVEGLSFSPDGRCVALVGEEDYFGFEVLTLPTFDLRFAVVNDVPPEDRQRYVLRRQCVFSGDSASLYCPLPSGEIMRVDAQTGRELQRWQAHKGAVHAISIRHDLSVLLSGGLDGTVKLWQLDDPPRRPAAPDHNTGLEMESLYGLVRAGESPCEHTVYVAHRDPEAGSVGCES